MAGPIGREVIPVIEKAAEHIKAFHEKEREQLSEWRITFEGGYTGQRIVPVGRAGVYVPGGTAVYPSSVLMNVIPAQVAGVREIVLVTPPDRETGTVSPMVLAVADFLNVREIYAVGGAQAIAAMAYGTETVRAVDTVSGPGNRWVTEAKRQVFGKVGIDSLAGPSEIVILADHSANPEFLASDLLSQAEHDIDARAILITDREKVLRETAEAVAEQLRTLPRAEIAGQALKKNGAFILVSDMTQGIDLVNRLAPEHLELHLEDHENVMEEIRNAGAVFAGAFTPEPVGDYWAGCNHILPTSGSARYSSALSVRNFLKWISVMHYDRQKLGKEAAPIARLARWERLEAHARAVECRFGEKREKL